MWIRETAGELTGHICLIDSQISHFAWETSRSLPFAWVTNGSLPSVQNYRPYTVFSSPMRKYEHPLCLTYFLFMAGYQGFSGFFPLICWSYLRTEISVTLSIGNKLFSRHHLLFLFFLWKPLCWCYLVTALNLLSSSSSAKLVYYSKP